MTSWRRTRQEDRRRSVIGPSTLRVRLIRVMLGYALPPTVYVDGRRTPAAASNLGECGKATIYRVGVQKFSS